MKTIRIKNEFKDDYITRAAGERLRAIVLEAARQKHRLELDFSGLRVASPSFFDEGFAKLVDHGWDRRKLDDCVRVIHLHPRDQEIFEEMCRNRGLI